MTNIESFKQALKAAKRDERHHTVAETRYWLEQYRMLAYQAVDALEKAEKQEPVAWVNRGENIIERVAGWDGYGAVYATPPAAPVQDPVAWAEEIISNLHACYDSELIKEIDSGDALIRLDAAIACVEEAAIKAAKGEA